MTFLLKWLAASLFIAESQSYKLKVHNKTFVPDEILHVTSKNISQACIHRQSVVINGTSPGPELRFQAGESRWIRVYNDIPDQNLTMHWHGLAQSAAPFSDGTPQASQWPIPPNHYFDYQLVIQDKTAGTYFYHSHVGFQAVSASGPLVITDKHAPPYKYDRELSVYLSDVFNLTDVQAMQDLGANPFVWTGETTGILVNGQGGNATCFSTPPSVLSVKPSSTYRVRFTGATALSFVALSFGSHNLDIIEADGAYTKPQNTSLMQIGAGQRFSALLRTKSCSELSGGTSRFWIQLEQRERPLNYTGYAQLVYDTSGCKNNIPTQKAWPAPPSVAPLTLPPIVQGWMDYELKPLFPSDDTFPTSHQVTRRVIVSVQQIVNGSIIWEEDKYPWTPDVASARVPYLVDLYKNATNALPNYATAIASGGIDPRVRAFPAKLGEILEVVIVNEGATPAGGLDVHPFHAHGAHVWDIGAGRGTYDPAVNEKKLAGTVPIKRDTMMLYRYNATTTVGTAASWRAWRIRIRDPGVFMIHCHILQHMVMGMQTVWVYGDASDILKIPKPMVEGYLDYGGGAYGNVTHYPTVVEY